jgi:sucrose-6-phosphate hydrolase SacC (GH32 family)
VNDHGTASVLYTGVKSCAPERATLRDGVHNFREVQCLATSADPQLLTWNKWKEPVIQPPNDTHLAGFRDPFLWRDGETWFLGVGSGLFKEGGRVLLYRSKDLRAWEYLHPLASGRWTGKESANPVESGEMWECPDFFPLGKKHVLLYSTAGQVIWESGELDSKENTFRSESVASSIMALTTRRKRNSTLAAIASSGAGYRKRAPKLSSVPLVGPDAWPCPESYRSIPKTALKCGLHRKHSRCAGSPSLFGSNTRTLPHSAAR